LEEITEKLMEKIIDMVNQNVQEALKKFQDTKNKKHEKTQKQISELKEDFNKHQTERKDTIRKNIYELKKTTQNIKQEFNKVMKNLRKKNNRNPGNKNPFSQTKKASPADKNKWKTESQSLKIK
jgi:hypothetical protein